MWLWALGVRHSQAHTEHVQRAHETDRSGALGRVPELQLERSAGGQRHPRRVLLRDHDVALRLALPFRQGESQHADHDWHSGSRERSLLLCRIGPVSPQPLHASASRAAGGRPVLGALRREILPGLRDCRDQQLLLLPAETWAWDGRQPILTNVVAHGFLHVSSAASPGTVQRQHGRRSVHGGEEHHLDQRAGARGRCLCASPNG
mmetsp:Transcript_9601/g.35947  ORF Transcript_9601/g.35947 Transcript_9601/m.35947 type:complete len:205 (-) Transcript_9601:1473-2087(-)